MVAGVLLWIALAAFVPYVLTPGVEHAVRHDGQPAASSPQAAPAHSPADAAPAALPSALPAASSATSSTATRLPAPGRNAG
ncbi:hypothetical protein [Paraburkholderia kururiensis]|uniref:Uncharacterized protein n=1 Tax=Paraburkholderia kururiensis TaxID=984307 RepID=A0ABZ0WQM6_9BURK|nr:hypothetical protein [Paraburkholderia kururiensis]WQD79687.1 hypothetical protein U0042_08405 [Paraburkholderia kururiensis]